MSEYTYTAKDFAAAEFAIDPSEDHPLHGRWVRTVGGAAPWWGIVVGRLRSDEQMAEAKCIPVYAEPYSPEALKRAWEHGVQGRVGPGDVAMAAPPGGGFIVDVIPHEDETAKFARVIWRAPGPEPDPVGDLAAALTDWYDRPLVRRDQLAELLHKHGVRVVTDDE